MKEEYIEKILKNGYAKLPSTPISDCINRAIEVIFVVGFRLIVSSIIYVAAVNFINNNYLTNGDFGWWGVVIIAFISITSVLFKEID